MFDTAPLEAGAVLQDAFEGSASSGEHGTHEAFVALAFPGRDEWCLATVDLHDSTIDGGARFEPI